MKRTLTALATALGLAFFVATSAFAWQNRVDGQPVSFSAGSTAAVYLWHTQPVGFSIRTTDPAGTNHLYTGTVTTDGTFVNVSTVKLDGSDSVSVDGSGHTLSFSFHTYNGIDGVDYDIQGGTGQRVDVQEDGVEMPTTNAFLGAYSVHPENMPFLVCRADNYSCNP